MYLCVQIENDENRNIILLRKTVDEKTAVWLPV